MSTATVDLLDRELDKRWFERRSPRLEAMFRTQQSRSARAEIATACKFVGLLYIAFGAIDAILIKDLLIEALVLRVVVAAVYIGGIVWQVRRGVDIRLIEIQCSIGIYIGFAAWLFLATHSVDTTSILYYAAYGLIFMLVANLFFNFSFEIALLSSGLITVTFLTWTMLYTPDIRYQACFGSLYILSFLLTAFLNFKHNRERYLVYLNACRADLRQQEAVLRGEELLRLSITDALTGLSNRRAIDTTLQELWRAHIATGQPFGIVLIDVDYFKLYNDRYGHQQGDHCLALIGQAMQAVAAPRGYALARFGGEEFAAMFQAHSAGEVEDFAEEIRLVVENLRIDHAARRDQMGVVTVSVGGAFSADVAGEKPERTVTAADLALYFAKEDRNGVRLFHQRMLAAEASDDLNAEVLRSAIAQGRVSAMFQPIVDVSSGRIWAAETLMRLKDHQGRAIFPDTFIPLAERTGAILELGEWILREACSLLASEPSLPVASVNLSAKQIEDPGFFASVEAIVREAGIVPSRLALEITEGGQISGNPEVARLIDQLNGIGVRVWLDDFGTGFAGLSCLSEFRFDLVKIDRYFVEGSDTPRGARLLKNIIDLIAACGQRSIVEGVEEARQIELISSFGVDLFQGYHLGRPMPKPELVQRLASESEAALPLGAA